MSNGYVIQATIKVKKFKGNGLDYQIIDTGKKKIFRKGQTVLLDGWSKRAVDKTPRKILYIRKCKNCQSGFVCRLSIHPSYGDLDLGWLKYFGHG